MEEEKKMNEKFILPTIEIDREEKKTSVKQEQIQDLLFNRELGWQEIIYDLINTEQLDPWDIDIIILTNKYLEKIKEFEETDFFVSSKVLLAASLLLRIKSEILLNQYVKSIDEILFGKKEPIRIPLERIELDEEIPELISRSPLPRLKKVTLKMQENNSDIKNRGTQICLFDFLYVAYIDNKIEKLSSKINQINNLYSQLKQQYNIHNVHPNDTSTKSKRAIIDTIYLTKLEKINKAAYLIRNQQYT